MLLKAHAAPSRDHPSCSTSMHIARSLRRDRCVTLRCACRHFGGSYKWLFYGDDDTLFFLDAAASMLQHLDPDLPYFITGPTSSI